MFHGRRCLSPVGEGYLEATPFDFKSTRLLTRETKHGGRRFQCGQIQRRPYYTAFRHTLNIDCKLLLWLKEAWVHTVKLSMRVSRKKDEKVDNIIPLKENLQIIMIWLALDTSDGITPVSKRLLFCSEPLNWTIFPIEESVSSSPVSFNELRKS